MIFENIQNITLFFTSCNAHVKYCKLQFYHELPRQLYQENQELVHGKLILELVDFLMKSRHKYERRLRVEGGVSLLLKVYK